MNFVRPNSIVATWKWCFVIVFVITSHFSVLLTNIRGNTRSVSFVGWVGFHKFWGV